jgi:hypothetical protein
MGVGMIKGAARASGRLLCLALLACLGLWPLQAAAQTDEIQVYTGAIAEPGVFNLTWHDNYTVDGQKTAAFPGGIVPNHTLNGTTEWAYGVTDWFEQGLYLPLYSIASNRGGTLNGWKLRELFAEPHADDQMFVYAINFEFSFNSKHWNPAKYSGEIRPILGLHLGQWDIFVNPILDTAYDGFKNLDFAPSARVAYNFSKMWAVALEQYADFGPISHFLPANQQSQQIFAVMDYSGEPVDIEAGVGFGLTDASDNLVLKLMFSRDLN